MLSKEKQINSIKQKKSRNLAHTSSLRARSPFLERSVLVDSLDKDLNPKFLLK